MHIVQLANFYGPRSGGLRTAIDRLAAGYCERGHRVTTIVPGAQHHVSDDGRRTLVSIASPVAPLLGGDYRMVVDRRAVHALMRDAEPDVIELSDKTSLVGPASWQRRSGTPVVVLSHERLDEVVSRATRLDATRLAIERYNRRLVGRVDAIVCASRYAAAEFDRCGAVIDHVPLGVDLERFRPRPVKRRVRARLVVAVRLSPEKGPDLLVDTSRALLANGCDHEMIVYGDGPLRARLERSAIGLPVRFAGFVGDRDELATAMATADVGIAPGPLETFGLAALELLASGTPVVVPDRGALAEIADGCSAIAADRSADAFAAAVRRVLAGDRQAQQRAARARAERYDWDTATSSMLDVFARVRDARTCSPTLGS